MLSVGAGLGLLVLAIYCLFLTEGGWLKIVSGLYIAFFFVVSIIAAFRSTEPGLHLIVPGLIALLMVFAYSIRSKPKDWP
jgi:hypothetical protein